MSELIESKKHAIEKLQEEILLIKEDMTSIKKLEDYSTEEKVVIFDRLYKSAESILASIIKDHYENNNWRYFCFEDIMNLLGNGVWKIYNRAMSS